MWFSKTKVTLIQPFGVILYSNSLVSLAVLSTSFVHCMQLKRLREHQFRITKAHWLNKCCVLLQVQDLISEIKNLSGGAELSIGNTPESQPLPPASFQTFLKKRHIPGVVLADHKNKYQNKWVVDNSFGCQYFMIKLPYFLLFGLY